MKRTQSGFSLIEVLVTLVIVAIALLGLLAVQARAYSMQVDTFNQRAAVELMSQLRERVSGNFDGYADAIKTASGRYNTSFTPSSAPAAGGACATVNACNSTTEVPAQLIGEWAVMAAARLPGAVGVITPTATAAGTFGLSVTLGWTEPSAVNTSLMATGADTLCGSVPYVAALTGDDRNRYRCLQMVLFPG